MKKTLLLLIAATLFAAGCADTSAPAPAVAPRGEDRYLVDPRTGYGHPGSPNTERKMDEAWRFFLAGDYANASKRLADIRSKEPGYAPADVAEAAILIRQGQLDQASELLARAPRYTASETYAAEVAFGQQQTRRAYDLYRDLLTRPDAPPAAKERLAALQTALFDETFHAAQSAASDAEAVRLLREALELNPGATPARVLLVQKLVAAKSWDEAHRELEPLVNSGEVDRPEVQEALAEIDAGRGRYQEAIVRYERLARRSSEPRYTARLEQIKEQFAAANMPPQYQRAIETESLTRSDFAVLTYWIVPTVRFAQNLGAPPIATDIGDVPGREEIIRAIALGLFSVDPVTRRVDPLRSVTAPQLARLASRVLLVSGARCAKTATNDPDAVLSQCNVSISRPAVPDAPVSGRAAAEVLEQVQRALQ